MNTLLEGKHGQFKENKADGVAEGYVCLTQFPDYSSGGGGGGEGAGSELCHFYGSGSLNLKV